MYRKFIAEVEKQKKLKRLTNKNIAQMTGYSLSSIGQFMCGYTNAKPIAEKISEVLGIKL